MHKHHNTTTNTRQAPHSLTRSSTTAAAGNAIRKRPHASRIHAKVHSRSAMRIWPSISKDCEHKVRRKRPVQTEDDTSQEVPKDVIQRRDALIEAYSKWTGRTPIMFIVAGQNRCLAAVMLNPCYSPGSANSWGDNVYFGRISNYEEAFTQVMLTLNLTPAPLAHLEASRFREFVINTVQWRRRLDDVKGARDYPILVMKLHDEKDGYSIDVVEKMYTFYVTRRLALANPHFVTMQFAIDYSYPEGNNIASVVKHGCWSIPKL